MLIQLNDSDLAQMPPTLCTAQLNWLQTRQPKSNRRFEHQQAKQLENSRQLELNVNTSAQETTEQISRSTVKLVTPSSFNFSQQTHDAQIDNSHVKISQLFDAGIITEGTPIRVKLKREVAKKLGRGYITNGLKISPKGTLMYNKEEFDKPSPLAEKVNGSSANGWEYVEAKKNGQWVCLDELRKIWRVAS